MAKQKKEKIEKENFIDFLASMTPKEINQLIEEKGKPRKMICPMFFYPDKN